MEKQASQAIDGIRLKHLPTQQTTVMWLSHRGMGFKPLTTAGSITLRFDCFSPFLALMGRALDF